MPPHRNGLAGPNCSGMVKSSSCIPEHLEGPPIQVQVVYSALLVSVHCLECEVVTCRQLYCKFCLSGLAADTGESPVCLLVPLTIALRAPKAAMSLILQQRQYCASQ